MTGVFPNGDRARAFNFNVNEGRVKRSEDQVGAISQSLEKLLQLTANPSRRSSSSGGKLENKIESESEEETESSSSAKEEEEASSLVYHMTH